MYRLTDKFILVCTRQCLLYNWVICCVPNSCGGCPSFIFFLSGGNGTSDSRACCGTKTAVVETSVTCWRLKYMLLDLVSSCYQNNLTWDRTSQSLYLQAPKTWVWRLLWSLHVQEFTFKKNDNTSIEYINLINKYLLIQSELTALTKKLPLKQIMSKTKQARVNWVRTFNNTFCEITHWKTCEWVDS